MNKEQVISSIESYVRNSAIDAFTNLRLNSIQLTLANGGVLAVFDTGEQFQQAVVDNPDTPIMGYVAQDNVYTFDEDVVLMRVPGRGVGQIAIEFLTDERT